MGYALLANVPPITGIYMAFFPVLLYFILGTSRHNSMGTFAVISIMVGKCVLTYSDPSYFKNNIQNTTVDVFIVDTVIKGPSPIQVATAVCFLVGLFQVRMQLKLRSAIELILYFLAWNVCFSTRNHIITTLRNFSIWIYNRSSYSCVHISA